MKIKSWNHRVWAAVIYSIIGFLIIFLMLIIERQKAFYVGPEMTGLSYLYRFLWCISFAFFGFAAIAYYWRKKPSPPWTYFIKYLPQLLIVACLVLGLLHFWERTSGYTFYYLSIPICSVLGFMVDYHWDILQTVGKKLGIMRERTDGNKV